MRFERGKTSCVAGADAIARTAALLAGGAIVAIKGIGGYHLACDATNATAVAAMRERKYRKERPFAVMARDLTIARTLVELDAESEHLLASIERPIVLLPAQTPFRRRRAEQSRSRRHAAVHAAAPSLVRRGRAGCAGYDERQSFERADRLRRRRCAARRSRGSPMRS